MGINESPNVANAFTGICFKKGDRDQMYFDDTLEYPKSYKE